MKKFLLLIVFAGLHLTSFSQVQFWSDDFENATAPSAGTRSPSYNGGSGGTPYIAYFLRTQGNNIDLDIVTDGPYSNFQGSWFWAGEDHDVLGAAEQTMVWSGIDISGKNNITFQGLFAAQSTYAAWESILFGFSHDDYVTVEYSIDGGAYQKLIDFRANSGAQPVGDPIYNQYKQLAEDTDFNGIGNGTVLTKAFNEFTKTIPGSGSTLSLRLSAYSNNSYTEEWAIDNFRLLSTPANSAPVASAPSAPTVNEDEANVALADNIQVNDVDGDNQSVTFTATGGTISLGTSGISFSGGTNGSASFTASGTLANINAALDAATFTPTPNLYGANAGTVSFVSNDGTTNSNNASVTFTIAGVNDDPTITGLPSSVTVTEDATTESFDISSATIDDIDVESGQLTLKLEATGGLFDIAAGTGITLSGQLTNEATFKGNLIDLNNYINVPSKIYFRPDANLSGNGAASVNVSINDNGNTGSGGGSNVAIGTVNVDITGVNDAPDAVDDNYDVDENTPQTGNVLTNDTDPEGNALTASLVTAPVNGTVVLNADGSFTYTPNYDYSGPDSLVYQVCDNGTPSLCDTATVYFDVLAAVNNAPVVSNTVGNGFWTEGNPPTILKSLIGVSDPDGDNITKAILTNLLFVAGDELSVTSPGPYSIDYNTSTGVLTLTGTGTAAEMQAALRTVGFRNSTDDPGLGNTRNTRIVSIFVEDENSATSDAVDNPGIFVSSINDAPTVTLPASISVMEDASSPLTGISFADVDAGSTDVTTTFSVPNGTFSASSGGGVTVTGSGTDNLSLNGNLTAINTYIAGANLNFLNQSGNISNQTLTVAINDNGNTGSGGALDDSGTATLTVTLNPPVVTSVSVPANGTYGVSQNLDFTINFDEDINVNTGGGVPALSLTIGSITREATYISGSGTAALVFRYTVQNGDLDADGIQVNTLSSNGGFLTNGSGTDADLSLNNVGNTSGVLVDGVAPSGYSVTIDQDPILPANESAISFTFAGAEIGTTYSYTFTSSGGGSSVSGNGTIAFATDQITGIDLSGLVAGTITLAATLEDTNGNTGSEVTDTSVKLAPITAQIASQSNVLCHGGSDGSLTVQVDGGTANYSYSWSNGASTSNSTSATNTISLLTAGDYSVTVIDGNGQEATALATIVEPEMATITTNAASNITISSAVLGGTVTYGDESCEKESGIVYSTTPNPTLSDTKEIMALTAGSIGEEITGLLVNTTYYVRAFSTNDNDVTSYGNEISFTTSTKILTIKADTGQGKVYGGTDPVLTYTATGFESGDDESILSGALAREAGEDAGTYAIQLGSLSVGPNYTINFIGADFTITAATLDITADAGQSKEYGAIDPVLTYTATGFESGDDESILSGALSRESGEDAGTYAIQLGSLSAGPNYTINFIGTDFTITKATLDISADAGQSKEYGAIDPVLTYTATGFESVDDESILSGALTREAGENAGTYAIQLGSLSAGPNYTINFIGTDFTIGNKVLTVTADAGQSKIYGATDPLFTYTVTGFEGGDDESILSGALTREAGEDAGTYAIQLGTLSAGSNYTINFTGADFTIGNKVLTVTADAGQSKIYGATDPLFTYTVTGFEGGDDESILSGALTREAGEGVGIYTIQLGTLSVGGNYTISFVGADFEITTATISGITFEDGSFVFDGTAKSLAITGTLPDGTSVAYAHNSRTDVGTQEVTATITGSNYNTLVLTADLTVTPADISGITFDDGSFVFDGTAKSLAISGTLPDGTSVAYADNSRTDVGSQEVTATITGSNYTTLVLTADLTVTPADVSEITFDDGSFVFDGTAKSLAISGNLPDGTSVTYTNNSRTDVGSQEVTATITGSNFTTLVLTADLTVTPADVSGITFDDGSFVFDGTAKSLAISGNVPDGTSVTYADNSRTDVGTQEVTATISGSNFTTLVLTADLTVTPADVSEITFDDGSFVFDGTAKSLAISGNLPDGTSVTYTNNSRTDVGSQEVTATITGSNFTTLVLTADLTVTPADVSGITFDDGSFVFDGTAKSLAISGNVPDGTSVTYADNSRTDVGTQEVTATISGSNFTTLVLTADLTVTPADVSGINFDDGSFVFDGTAKSLAISGNVPDGTSVTYADNSRTDVGTQEVTATISGSNFTTLVLTADLTVTPADVSGITFDDGSFVFDGTAKSLAISGNLPDGTSVTYTNNSRTDVGTQEVTATISGSNFTTLVLTADLTVTPADVSGITFDDGSFVFDGTAKSLAIAGTLPDGTSVAYADNSRTDVGTQEVTATITGSNYNTLVLTADLTVTPADVSGITFDDGSFVFDGTAKSLAITGTLPDGTSVAYTNNSRTDVGSQEVTATITGSNYNTLVLTADLTVTPADVSGITFDDGSFVFDGTAKSLAITGTLPDGTSVAYTNNSRTDVGSQEVTATITGSNYNTLVLTADLTVTPADITGITFDDGSFVFDGTAKSLAITGTLPDGTSVAYTNNSRTDMGTQEVTATITGSNYNTLVLTADLTVTPADISGITFEDDSFVFDGTAKSLAITGTLPDGTSVSYANNSRTDVGTQEVTATITGSNYNTLVLTADLTVTPADITGITFDDGSFVFDGTAKSLAITGTLPDGTSVAYTNNSRTDVGTQEVTVTISGGNYTELVLTAKLAITPATLAVTADSGQSKEAGSADPVLSYSVSGFVGGDDESIITGSLDREEGEEVGSYSINQGSLNAGSNYTIVFTEADFMVTEPANADSDGDGVPDPVEGEQGTDPADPDDYLDRDGDDVPDYVEEQEGTDPMNPGDYMDTDGDDVPDYVEEQQDTDPSDPEDFLDEDGDGIPDYVQDKAVIEFVDQSLETVWGTEAAELKVPTEVVAITAQGTFINLPVVWDLTGYEPTVSASSVYTGSVVISPGLFNPSGLQPSLEITVLSKSAPEDVTLSQNSFVAVPDQFFQEIGAFTVIDPTDDEHTLSLPEGIQDNPYFEVLDGILFWSSDEQAEGRTDFTIVLKVTDRAGNVLEKNFSITRERTPLEQLGVANTFTPNGDGVNDTWGMPALRYYSGVRISVFAVGGERLFYTENPDVRWDGVYHGKEMPVGAYLYVIEVGETGEVKRGMLNLLKE